MMPPGATGGTPMMPPGATGGSGYGNYPVVAPPEDPAKKNYNPNYTTVQPNNSTPMDYKPNYPTTMPPGATGSGTPMQGYNPMYPGAPGSEAAKPKTLAELANDSFRKGHDREALQYVCAAALASDEAAETLADDFRWVPYLKKPTMAVRFGVGVIYKPPQGYTGHPSPIGYVAPAPTNSNNPMGGAPMGSGTPNSGQPKPKASRILGQRKYENAQNNNGYGSGSTPSSSSPPNGQQPPAASQPPSEPDEFLVYYTGEVGEKVVDALKKRSAEGRYGDVLRRGIEAHESAPAPANNNPANGGAYMPNYPMGPMGNMNPGGEKKTEPFKPAAIIPGVFMLGKGSEHELLDEAEKQKVDFVILFEVGVRKNNKDATNNTKFKVMSLEKARLPSTTTTAEGESARELFVSGTINSNRVDSAREKNEADPLEAEINRFAEALDAEVSTTPLLEKVSTDVIAAKRANFLASQGKDADNLVNLANLAEIRCYQQAKLIKDKEAAEYMAKILGGSDKVKKLLSGKTEAERVEAIKAWLPKI